MTNEPHRPTLDTAADYVDAYMRRLAAGLAARTTANRVPYEADEILVLKRFAASLSAAFRAGMIDIEKDWPA